MRLTAAIGSVPHARLVTDLSGVLSWVDPGAVRARNAHVRSAGPDWRCRTEGPVGQ